MLWPVGRLARARAIPRGLAPSTLLHARPATFGVGAVRPRLQILGQPGPRPTLFRRINSYLVVHSLNERVRLEVQKTPDHILVLSEGRDHKSRLLVWACFVGIRPEFLDQTADDVKVALLRRDV